MKNILSIFVFLLFCVPIFAHETIQINPSADAVLDQSSASTNFGSLTELQTRPWTPTYNKRSVINFNLSAIPSGATIISAQLKLTITDTYGQQRTIAIHQITSNWTENDVTWSNFNNAFNTNILNECVLTFNQSTQAIFNLTQSVQNIVNGTNQNFGWLIKDKSEDDSQARWNFASKEHANANIRPVLIIEYEDNGNNNGGNQTVQNQFTFNLNAIADAKINLAAPNSYYGLDTLLTTYPWLTNTQRSVIKFDLSSLNNLPQGAVIKSAKLKMVSKGNFGQNRSIQLHRIQNDWNENTVTWNTINNNFHPQAIASDNLSWTDKLTGEWDVTNEVITYYQGIVPNYGWLIKDQTEDNSQAYWNFASKEHPNDNIHPILEVVYESYLMNYLKNQSCGLIHNTETETPPTSGNIINYNEFIPNENTKLKTLRINIHFMLLEKGHPDYPGNFTKYDDGLGNTNLNGYIMAERLIKSANEKIGNNVKMKLMPNNNTEILPVKYNYILNGVFFHENNERYYLPQFLIYEPFTNNFGENISEVLNVYYTVKGGSNPPSHTAYGQWGLPKMVVMSDFWEAYKKYVIDSKVLTLEDIFWSHPVLFNHELGHNLSLLHTIVYCDSDYCLDTPSFSEIDSYYNLTSSNTSCKCNFGNYFLPQCSNNLMDYSRGTALTPCQLGRAHWTIQNEMPFYRDCKFKTDLITELNYTDNKTYIANKVSLTNESVYVENNNMLNINVSEYFEINPNVNFEIKANAKFEVKLHKNCNNE